MFQKRASLGWVLLGACVTLLLGPLYVPAASVDLRITVLNPKDSPVTNCPVHVPLPQKVTPQQILDADGMAVVYDVDSRLYYIDGEVNVPLGTNVQLNIRLDDVWNIPDAEIDALLKRARDLVAGLKGRASEEEATAHLVGDVSGIGIEKKLEKIRASQRASAIRPGLKVADHITAYEEDLKILDDVVREIRHLENLSLKEGIDLDSLVWDREVGPQDSRMELPSTYKSAIYRAWGKSPAEWEKREPFKKELPSEITAADVVDAGGLEIMVEDDRTYVYTNEVVYGPKGSPTEEVSFNIQIRDKWDINAPRIVALKVIASNVLNQIVQQQKFKKMEAVLRDLDAQLDAVALEKGPETLDANYVAFFHDQAHRIDILEHKIRRIAAALNPQLKGSKMGFTAKPPSAKTTWALIYGIIIFLGVMSFLFFMFHKPKSDADKTTHVSKGGS